MTKKEIRNQILAIRRELEEDTVISFSKSICSRIITEGLLDDVRDICLYMPIKNEVALDELLNVCRQKNINIWLPRIIDNIMDFYLYASDTKLIVGTYNILEPDNTTKHIPNTHTLVIVPGSVFSVNGDRIGYGGGYYDRYMTQYPYSKYLAVCYDFQILKELPCEDHDQKPDIILSEQRIIYTS